MIDIYFRLGILISLPFDLRDFNGPVLLASPDGGVDIEEVAEKTPDRLLKLPIDINEGLTREKAMQVTRDLY